MLVYQRVKRPVLSCFIDIKDRQWLNAPVWCPSYDCWWIQWLWWFLAPRWCHAKVVGTLWWTNILPWKITIFYGKIHYFYGHFQLLFVCSPEGDDFSFDCHVSSWKSRKVLEYGDSRPLVTMQPSLEPVSWGWRCYVLIKYKNNPFDNCGEPCPLAISEHLILMIIYKEYINMFAVSGGPVMFFKEQSPGDFLRAALLDDSGLWLLGRPWCWGSWSMLESTHQRCTAKILWLPLHSHPKTIHKNLGLKGKLLKSMKCLDWFNLYQSGWGLAGIFLLGYDLSQFSNSAQHG